MQFFIHLDFQLMKNVKCINILVWEKVRWNAAYMKSGIEERKHDKILAYHSSTKPDILQYDVQQLSLHLTFYWKSL